MRAKLFGPKGDAPKPAPQAGPKFEVVFCTNATDAVEATRKAIEEERPFSMAFLDMRMPPGPDGAWAAERIRQLDTNVDIVVATAFSDVDPKEIAERVPPNGNIFYLQKPFHPHEIRQLATALGWRRAANEKIRRFAYFDGVTGLPNRLYFHEKLSLALEMATRHKRSMAVMLIDLDNFKRVNDTLGHAAGDALLNEVARRLSRNLRVTDAVAHGSQQVPSGEIARLGGDEFTVLLSELPTPEHAARVAERIMRVLSEPMIVAGQELVVTGSVGVATYPVDGADMETLLKHADLAMYFAKRAGRNAYRFFKPEMNESALRRMTLENHLRRALQNSELSVHYQPQVDVDSDSISGMEALLRWTNPELGSVSPVEFIPIAEEIGLIVPIGEWVLRSACIQARTWHLTGNPEVCVAVNVSARQFQQPDFVERLAAILRETEVEPSKLELELTESMIMTDTNYALERMKELKALGVQLAIDDFGTGYSSLAYLKLFPLDRLKIDKSFVQGVNISAEDRAIATSIVSLAHSLSMRVTAEGVEGKSELDFLKDQNCNDVQGYYYSRPLPAGDATRFLQRRSPTPE
jgi:diguanylate cyclase (GGDEF)-like protein